MKIDGEGHVLMCLKTECLGVKESKHRTRTFEYFIYTWFSYATGQ